MPPAKKTDKQPPAPPATVEPAPAPKMELLVLENNLGFRWNVAEVKTAVSAAVEKYRNLVVTEDNLPDMERVQKEIAGLRIKLNTFRVDTKKLLSEPATKFDAEVKELTAIIEEAELPIKEQLAKYEDARVEKRTAELAAYAATYAAEIALRPEHFKYEVPAKLTNRSMSDSAAKTAVKTAVDELLAQQGADDANKEEERRREEEARIVREQRDLMITILTNSFSANLGLKTPVTKEDILQLIAPDMPVTELPNLIETECKKRQQVELAAAAPAPTPVTIVERLTDALYGQEDGTQFQPPAVTSVPQTGSNYMPPPPVPPPWVGPPPAAVSRHDEIVAAAANAVLPQLFEVILRFPEMSIVNAGALKLWLSDAKFKYEVISQEPVKGE